jgi:flagellar protein FlbT
LIKELQDVIPNSRDLIGSVETFVASGSLYKALKEIRKLMKREEETMAA